jgi:hypothetical protein
MTLGNVLFQPVARLEFFLQSSIKYDIPAEMHMEFDIITSTDSKPNQAKIIIYNLSETTRNLFQEDFQAVKFYAGYDGSSKLIFSGVTTNVLHERNGVDWRTIIYAADGYKELYTIKVNQSFSKGTPVKLVYTKLAGAFGLPIEDSSTVFDTLLTGVTYSGLIKDVLDNLFENYDVSWSIQKGVVEIRPSDTPPLSKVKAVVLNANTGLLGSPVVTERTVQPVKRKKSQKKKGKQKETKIFGIKATALLIPDIQPGAVVKVDAIRLVSTGLSKLMEVKVPKVKPVGIYLCDRVRYIGNNYGGRFDVELEGDALSVTS